MGQTTTDRYNSGDYVSNNPTWHAEDSSWKAAKILQMLRKNAIEPRTICEVGCGVGEIVKVMADALPDCHFVGYEVSTYALQIADRKSTDRIEFKLGDAFGDSDVYDIAMAVDVFEHIPDYFGFLHQMTKKGTWKLYHIPLDMSVQYVLRGAPLLRKRRVVGHLHYFSKDTALATLADTGHEIIDYFYTASALDLGAKSMKAKLAIYPRKLLYALSPDLAARILGGYSLLVLCR